MADGEGEGGGAGQMPPVVGGETPGERFRRIIGGETRELPVSGSGGEEKGQRRELIEELVKKGVLASDDSSQRDLREKVAGLRRGIESLPLPTKVELVGGALAGEGGELEKPEMCYLRSLEPDGRGWTSQPIWWQDVGGPMRVKIDGSKLKPGDQILVETEEAEGGRAVFKVVTTPHGFKPKEGEIYVERVSHEKILAKREAAVTRQRLGAEGAEFGAYSTWEVRIPRVDGGGEPKAVRIQ